MVVLSYDEFLAGLICLIWIIFGCLIGVIMFTKYKRIDKMKYITISTGLTMIFITSPWWTTGMQFISIITTQNKIPDILYVSLGLILGAIPLITWIYTCSILTNYIHLKKIMFISIIFIIVHEIYIITGIFTDYELLIGYVDPVKELNMTYRIIPIISTIINVSSMTIIGIYMSMILLKSNNKEIHWKGRFLILCFLSFSIGTILDVGLLDEINDVAIRTLIMIIARMILIIGAIDLYFGLFLPKKVANWLIK